MPRLASALIGVAAALVVAAPAWAAPPRYAAPSGSGLEPCGAAAPCSLKKALADAPADGIEVIVKPGNYTYDAAIVVKKRLDIHGQAGQPRPRIAPAAGVGDQAIFDSGGGGAGQLTITRLDIRSDALPLHVYGADVVLSDLILTSTGPSSAAVLFESTGKRVMRDSVARTTGAGGVAIESTNGTLSLRNVTAWSSGSTSTGIEAYGLCTPAQGPGASGCLGGKPGHPEIDVLNTIAHGTSSDLAIHADPSATAQITIGHSNFASKAGEATGAVIVDDGGNQSKPPVYKTGLIGAFHESAGSPTIDAGVADGLNGSTDFDGDPRSLGKAPDIGADEFVTPVRADPGGGDPGSGDPGTGDPGTGDPGGGDPGAGPADTTVPLFTQLAIAPASFRAAGSGPSAAAKVGATTVFTLSEPAMVSFRVERRLAGRRSGKRCVKPARRNRGHKRCARFVAVKGGFDRLGAAGPNGFRFSGRVGGRKLRPGRYRLVGTAADGAGNLSRVGRTPFRIVRL